uniref:Ubiquitin carboxyl-terminal hydrolase n=1 Tax=Meloidogyne incognita TaxID=6306 RepID=A0A914LGB6_MELIC
MTLEEKPKNDFIKNEKIDLKSSKSNSKDNFQEVCGIHNVGNTCFMNSALQSLANVSALTNYFLNNEHTTEINEQNPLGTQGRLVKAYATFLRSLRSGQAQAINPLQLKFVIGQFAPRFNGYAQHDSQELTAFLLDGMHEDLNRITETTKNNKEEDSNVCNEPKTASEAWRLYKQRNNSIIVDLFHGQMKSTLSCNVCKNVSIKYDPFCFLSVPIPSNEQEAMFSSQNESTQLNNEENGFGKESLSLPIIDAQSCSNAVSSMQSSSSNLIDYSYGFLSWFLFLLSYINPFNAALQMVKNLISTSIPLKDCLRVLFSIDHLKGDDMYSCDKCKKLQDGIKHSSITRLPNVLIIHLKRFRHEGNYNTKLRTKITFSLYDLDMDQFVRSEETKDGEENNLSNCYDLSGLISHRGQNIEYGHYVAYCRNSSDGDWYEFDDAQVTRVSPQEVASQEPYVLFYERRNFFCENHGEDEIKYKEEFEKETINEVMVIDDNIKLNEKREEKEEMMDIDNGEDENILQTKQLESSATITTSGDCSSCCLQQKN